MTLTVVIAVIFSVILVMLILSWLISFVAFGKLKPVPRAVATVLTAWTIATLLYGYNSGSFLFAGIIYGAGAAIVFWERKYRYEKHWLRDDHRTDTFS